MLRIVAATDLTDRSDGVAARAALIAGRAGARVIHAHVLPKGASAARIAQARAGMETHLAAQGIADAEIEILRGTPELALAELAQDCGAGLLVLGLHRVRPVLDLLRLTTMERIVLRSDVPVLIARERPRGGYERVLASVDFAPACAAALAAAARIAPDAEFHAIHALQLDLRERFAPGDLSQSRAMTRAETLRSAFLDMPGLPARLHLPEIIPGGVHEVLEFRIEELRPDLLSIGTHSGRDPEALGNYARDLMRAPPTDVLVAKPPVAP